MVSGDHSKLDKVTGLISGAPMLTSFISEVPGLKIFAKKKMRTSKHADHSSTQPPAYERIKAQLERRKKRRQQAQQLQSPNHSRKARKAQKAKQNVEGGVQKGLVDQQSGSSNKEAQGSRIEDARREDPLESDGEEAARQERVRYYREAVAAKKKKRKVQKEVEDADRDLDRLEDILRGMDEGCTTPNREERLDLEKLASQRRSQMEDHRRSQELVIEGEEEELEVVSIQPPQSARVVTEYEWEQDVRVAESATESESEEERVMRLQVLPVPTVSHLESSQLTVGKKRVSQ